jgi:heat shock protein HtpX
VENFPNIYEQQKRNRNRTIVIMIAFVLFFGFLGYGFDLFYFGVDPLGVTGDAYGFPMATIVALAVGSLSSFWGLQSGAKAVLSSAQAFPVPDNDPKYQTLNNIVDEMAIASGLPRPKVYIVPDPDPNAFATGKDPEHSYIAVTQGLLDTLNREELQGVIAHEMSHVRNYDIRVMTVIAALVGAIFLLSDWGGRMMRFGVGGGRRRSNSRSGGGGGPLVLVILAIWLIGLILAPILSQILAMAVSRQREYLADASGAELTRNPLALANALSKLESAAEPTASIKKGSAHLCIVDPIGRKMNLKEGGVAELFGTHPPISKRITLLKAMAYQQHSVQPAA